MMDLDRLPGLDLATVNSIAAFQTRSDRKYVVSAEDVDELLANVSAQVLEIAERRSFRYSSTYFDTPQLEAYLGAVRRRPCRFKVRTRSYVDTGGDWLEVKRRDGRGYTVKHRAAHMSAPNVLDPEGMAFVASFDGLEDVADRLLPVITTTYERCALVVDGGRVTIDHDVRCSTPDGRVARVDGVVVETKAHRSGCAVDRALWRLGRRPLTISKFGVGMAALHPDLPANKWHRTLGRHVSVLEPANVFA